VLDRKAREVLFVLDVGDSQQFAVVTQGQVFSQIGRQVADVPLLAPLPPCLGSTVAGSGADDLHGGGAALGDRGLQWKPPAGITH
jgi:hypothetical protein